MKKNNLDYAAIERFVFEIDLPNSEGNLIDSDTYRSISKCWILNGGKIMSKKYNNTKIIIGD